MIALLFSCTFVTSNQLMERLDADEDGYPWPIDCDPDDKDVHPDQEEDCRNFIDDNCDGHPNQCAYQTTANAWLTVTPTDVTSDFGQTMAVTDFAGPDAPVLFITGSENSSRSQIYLITDFTTPPTTLEVEADVRILAPSPLILEEIQDMNNDSFADIAIGKPNYGNGGAYGIALGPLGLQQESNIGEIVYTENAEAGTTFASLSGFIEGNGNDTPLMMMSWPGLYGGILLGKKWRGEVDNVSGLRGEALAITCARCYNSRLGQSMANAGDFNGDGFQDLIVGAPNFSTGEYDQAGAAFLILGPLETNTISNPYELESISTRITGLSNAEHFGSTVSGGFDINDDGYDDLLITAPNGKVEGFSRGTVSVILGNPDGTMNHDHMIFGLTDDDGQDISAQFSPSMTTEVKPSIVIGNPSYDTIDGLDIGAVWIFSDFQLQDYTFNDADIQITGNGARQYFGQSVVVGNDLNKDGWHDIVVSAPGVNNHGEAYIFSAGF